MQIVQSPQGRSWDSCSRGGTSSGGLTEDELNRLVHRLPGDAKKEDAIAMLEPIMHKPDGSCHHSTTNEQSVLLLWLWLWRMV